MKKIIIFFVFLIYSLGYGGEFTVTPIRIDLDKENQSASITVSNDGKTPINFVIKEMSWTQDMEGTDSYTPSQDLIFFPKSFKLEGGTSRVIRIGLKKVIPLAREKAYRIFVEEIPEGKLEGQTGVAIAIRFGVPVFIKPDKEELNINIEKVSFEKEALSLFIKNKGNQNIRFNTIDIIGLDDKNTEIFKNQIAGWYVFPDATRKFTAKITPDDCKKINRLILNLNTDSKVIREEFNVQKDQCK